MADTFRKLGDVAAEVVEKVGRRLPLDAARSIEAALIRLGLTSGDVINVASDKNPNKLPTSIEVSDLKAVTQAIRKVEQIDFAAGLAALEPTAPSEIDGSPFCFFCNAWLTQDLGDHRDDCLWLAAKARVAS